ncbi:MAG TPA: DegT/DnrJ/EryC1/StrS family aminotransferase [Euryarchaeota archaeon]|nr:DegT/DnrJ/EryC1/StrS family aminotransferase [Euryarchaeota archaeon]
MTQEMIDAAVNALRNERMSLGESVFKFEAEFASMVGVKKAVSVSSGTDAIQLTLEGMRVPKKSTVITSPMSFIASANAIMHAGCVPRFCDIDKKTYCMDPKKLRRRITTKTTAIVPVHLYGYPSDMDGITEMAREKNLVVIEDACQAHGAIYHGRRTGSIGNAGCFSFYATKNMTVGGDGGMITTDDEDFAERVTSMRHCGRMKGSNYDHDIMGYTTRLNSVNAAIGREQLRLLPEWNERRRAIAAMYDRRLKNVGDLKLPLGPTADITPVYHLYVVRTQRRNDLSEFLKQREVQTAFHYPVPIHLQPIYRQMFGYKGGEFKNTEKACKEVLSLPMYPGLSDEQVGFVCDSIIEFFGR